MQKKRKSKRGSKFTDFYDHVKSKQLKSGWEVKLHFDILSLQSSPIQLFEKSNMDHSSHLEKSWGGSSSTIFRNLCWIGKIGVCHRCRHGIHMFSISGRKRSSYLLSVSALHLSDYCPMPQLDHHDHHGSMMAMMMMTMMMMMARLMMMTTLGNVGRACHWAACWVPDPTICIEAKSATARFLQYLYKATSSTSICVYISRLHCVSFWTFCFFLCTVNVCQASLVMRRLHSAYYALCTA